MKKFLLFIAAFAAYCLLPTAYCFAQGGTGPGGSSPPENPKYRRFTGQASTPANPATGQYRVYVDNSGNLKMVDSTGTVTTFGGGGTSAVTGTGTNGQLTLWSGTTTVAGDAGITYTTGSPTAITVNNGGAGLRGFIMLQQSNDGNPALYIARKAGCSSGSGTTCVLADVTLNTTIAALQMNAYANGAYRSAGKFAAVVTAISGSNIDTKLQLISTSASVDASKWEVLAGGNLVTAGASATPFGQLSNTATDILDSGGSVGVNASLGLGWAMSGASYAVGLSNTSATTGARGVLIKTASTTVGDFALNVMPAGQSVLWVTGSKHVLLGNNLPADPSVGDTKVLAVYSAGNTSGTFGFQVQNSSGTNVLQVRDDAFTIANGTFTGGHMTGGGATPAVTNTTANSCGTTAATIVGTDNGGKITVGATAGTSCTVTFATAWTNAPACTVSNETTANLARATSTTTTVILAGTFVAGDVLSYICVGR